MEKAPRKYSVLRAGTLAASIIILSAFTASHASYDWFKGEKKLLSLLPAQEQTEYNSLKYLMNCYQRRQYLRLDSVEQRREWAELFWLMLDPTPTTDWNERRIEHEARVQAAYERYNWLEKPGWDSRGEILIRYGEPDHILKTEAVIGYYSQRMPGEIWYYNSLGFLVSFTDDFLNGRYSYLQDHYSFDFIEFARREGLSLSAREEMEGLRTSSAGKLRIELLPQHIDPFLEDPAFAMNPDNIGGYIAGIDAKTTVAEAENYKVMKFSQRTAEKAATNFFVYLGERPFLHTPELVENRLTTYFDVTAFKGGPGKLRTEINFEVPAHELESIERESGHHAEVELRVIARDTKMKLVAFKGDLISASLPAGIQANSSTLLPGQVVMTLEPGYYRLGIEAIDRCSGKRGSFSTSVELPSFDDRLAVSDIQFARAINESDSCVKFMKGNLQVIPHPLHAYRIPYPLVFYFEIYGLDTDGEDIAFYKIEYEIVPLEKRRWGPVLLDVSTAISSSFETSGFGAKHVQRLEIATENLWEGPFELTVKVTDRRTRLNIEKSTKFSILD